MKWIWIRHGQTAENEAGRFLGHYDAPLAARGKEQAEKMAFALAGESVGRLFASDLGRALETAKIIAAKIGQTPVPVKELRELNFGSWDRKRYEELMVTDQHHLEKWYENPFDLSPPGGESLRQLGSRVDNWLRQKLITLERHQTIIVVTHGGPIRWFQSRWIAGDETKFWDVPHVACGELISAVWDGSKWRYV
jgi:alpha-ribazole phosphatase